MDVSRNKFLYRRIDIVLLFFTGSLPSLVGKMIRMLFFCPSSVIFIAWLPAKVYRLSWHFRCVWLGGALTSHIDPLTTYGLSNCGRGPTIVVFAYWTSGRRLWRCYIFVAKRHRSLIMITWQINKRMQLPADSTTSFIMSSSLVTRVSSTLLHAR